MNAGTHLFFVHSVSRSPVIHSMWSSKKAFAQLLCKTMPHQSVPGRSGFMQISFMDDQQCSQRVLVSISQCKTIVSTSYASRKPTVYLCGVPKYRSCATISWCPPQDLEKGDDTSRISLNDALPEGLVFGRRHGWGARKSHRQ